MSEQREAFEKWKDSTFPDGWGVSASDEIAFAAWQAALSGAPSAEPVGSLHRTQRNMIECVYRGYATPIDGHQVHADFVDVLPLNKSVPIYLTPPNLSAAVAAAREQDAQRVEQLATSRHGHDKYADAREIRALQDPDELAALREFGMRVAEEVEKASLRALALDLGVDTCGIVDRVLKGEREMFFKTKAKIEALEYKIKCLKIDYDMLNDRYWRVVKSHDALLKRLGLAEHNVPSEVVLRKKGELK